MTTGKQLNVQNATVTTATIEVKTLTIGARQVTQGIFRQLIEEPLVAEDGTLNGVPWGHVTWHPDGCTNDNHWHIVWQRGEDLRRSFVAKEVGFGIYYCREANALMEHQISRAAHGLSVEPLIVDPGYGNVSTRLNEKVDKETGIEVESEPGTVALKVARMCVEGIRADASAIEPISKHAVVRYAQRPSELAAFVINAIDDGAKISLTPDYTGVVIDAEEEVGVELRKIDAQLLSLLRDRKEIGSHLKARVNLAELLAILDKEIGASEESWGRVQAEYDDAVRAEAARRQRHRDVRATLAQLPQLFIGG